MAYDITTHLPAGQQLTVTADANSSGSLVRLTNSAGGGDSLASESIAASGSAIVGPFGVATRWRIVSSVGGPLTYSVSIPERVDVTDEGVGAIAGTNVSVVEYGNGVIHRSVITLDETPVTLTDEAGVVLYGGQKVYDFPEGVIVCLGAVADLSVAVGGDLTATAEGDFGLGTVTASNNNTLATTEQNIIPTTAIAALESSAGPATGYNVAAIAPLDGTTTPIDAFLNFLWDDADHNGGTMTVSGTVTIVWSNLGSV